MVIDKPLYFKKDEKKIPNVRKLSELPYQQIHGEMGQEVEETLCDLEFIEAKCIAEMLFDLVNDCETASKIYPLPAINVSVL